MGREEGERDEGDAEQRDGEKAGALPCKRRDNRDGRQYLLSCFHRRTPIGTLCMDSNSWTPTDGGTPVVARPAGVFSEGSIRSRLPDERPPSPWANEWVSACSLSRVASQSLSSIINPWPSSGWKPNFVIIATVGWLLKRSICALRNNSWTCWRKRARIRKKLPWSRYHSLTELILSIS